MEKSTIGFPILPETEHKLKEIVEIMKDRFPDIELVSIEPSKSFYNHIAVLALNDPYALFEIGFLYGMYMNSDELPASARMILNQYVVIPHGFLSPDADLPDVDLPDVEDGPFK